MSAPANQTITAVAGVRVGHATHANGATGCTVLLGPFRAACDVRGFATGTREVDTLSPTHVVPQIDALLLTGGSAFGLSAADGVVAWLAERGIGFDTGITRVPIVPAAVIFDLTADRTAPGPEHGRAACDAATSTPIAQGRVGAGAGATIGKLRGREHADPGGVGSFALRTGDFTVAALAVVNALGDVIGFDGRVLAGARDDAGRLIDSLTTLKTMPPVFEPENTLSPTNTTLVAIATDAPLSRDALQTVARAGSSGIVRRIAPANTLFDGDVVFALSTAARSHEMPPANLLALSAAAQLAVEQSILQAVFHAGPQ